MTSNIDDDESGGSTVDSKVARLIEAYALGHEYGDRLEELWTADGEKRESLRSLADQFNERLLESAIEEAGMSTVEGEVGNLYRLLTADEVSSGNRIEARQRLEQNGIDIERLERDFVTYQAIRTYLKEYRGATYEHKSSGERVETIIQRIQRLRSRTQSVAERSLNQLKNTDHLSLGKFRIFVDISVLCEDCDTQYGLVELLQEGSCECGSA